LKKLLSYLSILLVAVLLVGTTVSAQVESGSIAGTVTDQSGALVPGAAIVIKNLGTNAERTATSSSNGAFTVTGLEPANYEVRVTSGNFQPYDAKVEVTVGGRLTLDAKLSVTAAVSEVEVIAEGGTAVNTQTQELSQVVSAEQVASLPSLTRNPYDFVAISGNISNGDAGSSGSGTGMQSNSQNSTTRGVGFNINGQRSSGTEILLDGVENVSVFGDGIGIFVPLDSVQAFGDNFVLKQMGRGFVKVGGAETDPEDLAMVEAAWAEARAAILSGEWDLVILDEINYAIGYGMLDPERVAETLLERPEMVHVILTGRNAHPRLVEIADTVTEMREVKHAYQKGVQAQRGIEY